MKKTPRATASTGKPARKPSKSGAKVGSTVHVIKRKQRVAAAPSEKQTKAGKTKGRRTGKNSQAKRVGEAVGTILGKVIGTVEQAVATVVPSKNLKGHR